MKKRCLTLISMLLVLLLPIHLAYAKQTGPSFIRDAEIEHTLRSYAIPIFNAAGLNGNDVAIYIINDRSLNAFVAGGQRLFMFTGLLERVDTPNQLKGVIAHETGHIAGGHLARTQEALENATFRSIIGILLGAVAIAAGGGAAGGAVIAGSSDVAAKSFLEYSRTQESSADQASITYLDNTQQSGRGMVEFLEILDQTYRSYNTGFSYYRSHPITSERIAALRQRVEKSPYRDRLDSPESVGELNRMQAKLFGYTRTLSQTLRKYPVTDQSIPGRYARAIAYFKYPDLDKALKEVDSLLAEAPTDPYFHELKGQSLYENGDPQGALPSLETAIKLAPREPLILTQYGRVLNATGNIADNNKAIEVLTESLALDPGNAGSWDQLAIAYSRNGDTGMLALASAERYLLGGNYQKAIFHAKRAQDFFNAGTPAKLRAEDIITLAGEASRRK
ncbi:MAG: M48 family metalloprotease [Sneathiella sp.]